MSPLFLMNISTQPVFINRNTYGVGEIVACRV